jgi:hypothetical protein
VVGNVGVRYQDAFCCGARQIQPSEIDDRYVKLEKKLAPRDWGDKAAAVREYTRRVGNRGLELDRYGEPRRFDTMPSQPSLHRYSIDQRGILRGWLVH